MDERFKAKLMLGNTAHVERLTRQREKKLIKDLQGFIDNKLSEKETAKLVGNYKSLILVLITT